MPKFLTIDPGISGTGWALWNREMRLVNAGILTGKGKWNQKAEQICEKLAHLIRENRENHTITGYIEIPSFFQSAGGEMVARRGDLVKLTWVAGMLHRTIVGQGGFVRMVPVSMWKGQLPKHVIENRVMKRLGIQCVKLGIRSHAFDAVGIGLYLRGDL